MNSLWRLGFQGRFFDARWLGVQGLGQDLILVWGLILGLIRGDNRSIAGGFRRDSLGFAGQDFFHNLLDRRGCNSNGNVRHNNRCGEKRFCRSR
jgi:hypothetical protein